MRESMGEVRAVLGLGAVMVFWRSASFSGVLALLANTSIAPKTASLSMFLIRSVIFFLMATVFLDMVFSPRYFPVMMLDREIIIKWPWLFTPML